MYFCKTGLKIYPKRKIELNAAVRGNVIHYCLCEILKKYGKKITGIGDAALSDEISFFMDEYYNLPQIGGSYAKTGRFNANYRRTSNAVADILENMRDEFSQSDFVPDGFELNVSPLNIRVQKGMDVIFAGKADRADIFVSGGGKKFVRVIDYKTGTYKFDFKDLYYGLNSQLLLYLFALIKADGRYKGCRPAGFLYAPASSPPPGSGGKFESAGGIVLDDDGVIEAMEKGGAGIYIPVKKKKDGYSPSGSSYLIKEKAFSKLWEYSERLIAGMAENLSGGNIPALPLSKGGAVPCDYCDYGGICGNYPDPESRVCSAEAKEKLKAEILYNNE
jgi:ATP-dependent helicase/nuclease subunit B